MIPQQQHPCSSSSKLGRKNRSSGIVRWRDTMPSQFLKPLRAAPQNRDAPKPPNEEQGNLAICEKKKHFLFWRSMSNTTEYQRKLADRKVILITSHCCPVEEDDRCHIILTLTLTYIKLLIRRVYTIGLQILVHCISGARKTTGSSAGNQQNAPNLSVALFAATS